jgi:hypothetical protein
MRQYPERPAQVSVGIDKVGSRRRPPGRLAFDHLICPIGAVCRKSYGPKADVSADNTNAGRELAPAFTKTVNRLLWRHRARPSATLDKMRTEL